METHERHNGLERLATTHPSSCSREKVVQASELVSSRNHFLPDSIGIMSFASVAPAYCGRQIEFPFFDENYRRDLALFSNLILLPPNLID